MIKSFQHKGLKAFYEKGTTKGIRPDHEKRLRFVLGALEGALSGRTGFAWLPPPPAQGSACGLLVNDCKRQLAGHF